MWEKERAKLPGPKGKVGDTFSNRVILLVGKRTAHTNARTKRNDFREMHHPFTGPPIQSTGPPQTDAGVGIGILNRKIIVNGRKSS